MPTRQQRNPEVASLISEIVKAGKSMTPPVTTGEMAKRAGISPETLIQGEKLGRGDIAVSNLAAIVGLQLKLATNNDAGGGRLAGSYFEIASAGRHN